MTLARHATAMEPPEPTVMIRQPDGETLATAQETAADRKPGDGAAARTDPAPEPELECLGDQIAELSARIDAATYELLCQLREFDRRYGWEGWRSCAHWLNWRTGLDLGAAREKLRVAAALADLNHIAAAMARGQLSYSKVRALTRVATPTTEAQLLAVALGATASHVERLVRAWRRADRDAQPDAEQVLLASRTLSMQVDEDGMVVLRGRLTPEVGAVLLRAVEAALEQVPASAEGGDGGESTIAQRRADALGLMAESALAGGLDPGNSVDRFQVTVHVQADTLAAREAVGEARRGCTESRSTGSAAPELPNTAAHAASHIAAETQPTGSAAAEPPSAAADAASHVAAETRSTGSAASEPPNTAAVAALAHCRGNAVGQPDGVGAAQHCSGRGAARCRGNVVGRFGGLGAALRCSRRSAARCRGNAVDRHGGLGAALRCSRRSAARCRGNAVGQPDGVGAALRCSRRSAARCRGNAVDRHGGLGAALRCSRRSAARCRGNAVDRTDCLGAALRCSRRSAARCRGNAGAWCSSGRGHPAKHRFGGGAAAP